MPSADDIVAMATTGMKIADIARACAMTQADVLRVLDTEAAENFSGEALRRAWMIEARRLDALGKLYYARAMEGDAESAVIFLKTSERKATLTGMNAPIGHAVQVMHTVAPQPRNSVEDMRATLDELMKH